MRRSLPLLFLFALLFGWIAMPVSDAAQPPARGDIAGLVLANGAPAAGATVQLYGGSGFIDHVAETISGSNGTFRFRRIAAGNYEVRASRLAQGAACTGSAPVTVVAGQTANVTVEMTCQIFPP